MSQEYKFHKYEVTIEMVDGKHEVTFWRDAETKNFCTRADGGPSVEYPDGRKFWYDEKGKFHNVDGPAMISPASGEYGTQYYIHGEQFSEHEFYKRKEARIKLAQAMTNSIRKNIENIQDETPSNMNFYFLVCEQSDGFSFPIRSTVCSSKEEIEQTLKSYKTELYKSVYIRKVSISLEKVISLLVSCSGEVKEVIMEYAGNL
jgi:hypothetical protein